MDLPKGADFWGMKRILVDGGRRRKKALKACAKV